MGVLSQSRVIYNSQPYVNTFISALMNWFLRFERKRFPSSAWKKKLFPTRERELRLGLAVALKFLQPFVGEATQGFRFSKQRR